MLEPGELIDIWVIEAALGTGGMGSVYRCHNKAANRILAAVKVLDANLARYPEAEARFIREADILGQLDHPNIVKVRNVRPEASPPYIEMEFVAGMGLDERMHRGAMRFAEAIGVMRQCADAVAYLHAMGIRHRDIKPANVLIMADSRIKLVDFGLAVEAGASRITQHGVAFGTVSYAPPEWIAPEQLDPTRWDVYALGVVFYELLTGLHAFPVSGVGNARQQAMQVIVAKQGHPPLDPGEHYNDDVRALIAEMTHPDAGLRLADAAEIARRIRSLEPTMRASGVTLTPAGMSATTLENLLASTTPDAHGALAPSFEPRAPVPAISRKLPPVPRPTPARRLAVATGITFGLGAVVFVGAAALTGGALYYFKEQVPPEPTVRTVVVSLQTPLEVPFDVVLENGIRDPSHHLTFLDVPVGVATLSWAVGAGCTVQRCLSVGSADCPLWCAHGTETEALDAVEAPFAWTLSLQPPEPRPVSLALVDPPPKTPITLSLGEQSWDAALGAVTPTLTPGPHTLTVTVGSCPLCADHEVSIVVPLVGPAVPVAIPLPALAVPKPVPVRARGHVTNGALGAWIATNPRWGPGGEFAGSGKYLTGWTADGPPADALGSAPRGITANLAEAYCKSRGGLARVADAPMLPDEGELRRSDSGVVLLQRVDDAPQTAPVSSVQTLSVARFRCKGG